MSSTATPGSPEGGADADHRVDQLLREMNEALLVSSVRQNELAEKAQKAETAMRDSETRYRRLFQSARDGILILDAETGRIIDANALMCGLLGHELPELLGKELWEIGLFEDIAANTEAFKRLQREGYLRYEHLSVPNLNGKTTHVEFVSNIYTEGNRLVAQCNVRDISERSRMEKQILHQTEELADQSRRKDEFLAMLSHELRNPLAPIRAAVHLLKLHERGSENPIQKQARDIIERQVANLTKLISDLLEVSRVVSGRIRLDLQHVDLKQIVEHALQTAGPLIEQHKHTLTLNLCGDPVWANADAARLEEVMVNLLNNAAKYTPDGGRIEVGCEHHREGGESYALVWVRDNGVGIDEDLLPHLFDLFTQADRSLARSAGGLGIGLSLAHRLVALHGGTVNVQSNGPGKGSEFTVKLPLIPPPLITAPVEQPHRVDAPRSDGAAAVRVLVVDDNIDLVMMLSSALRHKGYSVQIAYNGPDGLKIAQQWRPDIALLDIGLPGLDGYEVARRLRSDPVLQGVQGEDGPGTKGARMRLIALTGYGREADIALSREVGFDGHMVKPCDFNELEKMMTAPASKT